MVQKLEQGVLTAGFATEQWTQARVPKVIMQKFRVHYHCDYISRLMRGLGWSVQKLYPRAIERDKGLSRD
ncbi:MAG: winged helix-turn-helix domain-containing protein [Anaerolineae bacterium]|nr:winged helix-turn-helix domain-containing protein [Anaerolineae bacterium]